MNMSDVMQPKWWLATKRGWGILLAGGATFIPMVATLVGLPIDASTVGVGGEIVTNWLESTGQLIGFGLLVWGSFRPTAPLSVTKPV